MKTLVIFVAIALSAFVSNAQEVIELKEAKVEFSPLTRSISNQGNSFTVNVTESYSGEFTQDPIAFMNTHFDIKEVIAELGVKEYQKYVVSFRSKQGTLTADFDTRGNLVSSYMRFKNIAIPSQLRHQLYRDYQGWAMVKNLHVASEQNGQSEKNYYRITMKKGNKKQDLKINSSEIGRSTLVALK